LVDLEKAMFAPQQVFGSPEAVADHRELTEQQKIEILQRWYYDAAEIQVAQEEGMAAVDNGNAELMRRIVLALDRLAGDAGELPGPSKQGRAPARKPL
jgi:hypothetical protein